MGLALNESESQISENLVNRILCGDKSAESEMVHHYQKRLYNSVFRQAWDEDLTNDIVQDTWLITLEKIRNSKLRNKKSLGSFISRIGSYQLIMHYRKNSKQPFLSEDISDELEDEQWCPDNLLCNSQFKQVVLQLLNSLNKKRDRELLWDFYMVGESKKELCSKFELSPEHFDRVLYRARERFKVLWSNHINNEEKLIAQG